MPKRRRGFHPPGSPARFPGSGNAGMAGHRGRPPSHRPFEDLVDLAVRSIPMPFARALDEVAIVIADEPDRTDYEMAGSDPDEELYGLYEGTPRTEWGADLVPFPNKITLFRLPLEEDFPDPADLAEEVRETVIHELAHHLGIDDDRLHELGHE
jgi:predicted Zn-dependent protease with MMP-like domain